VGDGGCVDGKLTVKATMLSGNGLDATCGVTQACADVGSSTEPRLDASSVCGTSYVSGSGMPGSSWGICTLD
jgi:hypothetical protein